MVAILIEISPHKICSQKVPNWFDSIIISSQSTHKHRVLFNKLLHLRCTSIAVLIGNRFYSSTASNGDEARLISDVKTNNRHRFQ